MLYALGCDHLDILCGDMAFIAEKEVIQILVEFISVIGRRHLADRVGVLAIVSIAISVTEHEAVFRAIQLCLVEHLAILPEQY